MDQIRTICPAKVNFVLEVLGRRPDGYHNLESVILPVSLWDELVVVTEEAESSSLVSLEVRGEVEGVPLDDSNLVCKAVYCFQRVFSRSAPVYSPCRDRFEACSCRVKILLEKHIPPQAGLGGGSSDAAGVLRGLNRLWRAGYSLEALARIGAQIGSDVPFFIYGKPAIVRGRGEIVQPFGPVCPLSLVLIKPPVGVSTAWAYHQLRLEGASQKGQRSEIMVQALREGDLKKISLFLYNDLEGPVLSTYPEVERARRYLLEQGCLGVLVSGSGSTVFGLTRDRATAEQIARETPLEIGRSWAVETIGSEGRENFV